MKNSFIAWCVIVLYVIATLNGIGWLFFGRAYGAGISALILAVIAFPVFKEACKATFGTEKKK